MAGLEFDSEMSRRIESTYVTPDIIEQRRQVRALLSLQPGEAVLDIGVGPGILAAEMAAEVGPAGRVCGIDISDSMLALAETRAHEEGSAAIELQRSDADPLPYADGSFDVVVSTQVLEYVEDIPGTLAEIRRVLRPGGRVLLLDTDWDSIVWHSTDDDRMRRVLEAFDEHLVDPHLPRTLRRSLTDAGFTVSQPRVLPLFNAGYDRETYSAGMLGIIASFVSGRGGLTDAEIDGWADDLRNLAEDYFFSVNRYLFVAVAP